MAAIKALVRTQTTLRFVCAAQQLVRAAPLRGVAPVTSSKHFVLRLRQRARLNSRPVMPKRDSSSEDNEIFPSYST